MSRTDKDRPYWVKVNDNSIQRVPFHDHVDYFGNDVECDFGEVCTEDTLWARNCGYDLGHYEVYADNPDRKLRRGAWFGPVRTRTRNDMVSLRKEYREFGEVDDYVGFRDHRHSSLKGSW